MVAAGAKRLGRGRGCGAAGEDPAARPVLTQDGPGTTAPEAAGVAPTARRAGATVWKRGSRDREQGRHYRPTPPVPRPQPRLEPWLGPPREGRRRGTGGTGREGREGDRGGRGGEETGGGAGPRRGPGRRREPGRAAPSSVTAPCGGSSRWRVTRPHPALPCAARVAAGDEGSLLPECSHSLWSAILCGARCPRDDGR